MWTLIQTLKYVNKLCFIFCMYKSYFFNFFINVII